MSAVANAQPRTSLEPLPEPRATSPLSEPQRPSSPGPDVTLAEFEVLDNDGGRSLGKGSFGLVRRVRLLGSPDVYALKTMQKVEVIEGDLIDQVEREIQVQRHLKHENVLRLYKHFEDVDAVYLLLEYCAKGELYQLLRTRKGRRFSEEVAQHYFTQVTQGLRYLHSQSIIHRDLKPENLLINHDDVLKIADFGWCAVSSVTRTTFCGTLDYLAPEMIQGRGHNHTLDIWSLGVLLYEMVVGRPPFQSTNHVMLISKILDMQLQFPAFVPQGIRDLVQRLLQKEPTHRLPLDQVLKHYWVLGTTPPTPDTSPLNIAESTPLQNVPQPALPPAIISPRARADLRGRVLVCTQQSSPTPAAPARAVPRLIAGTRHNLSAPQTPVQQMPFRGVQTQASTIVVNAARGNASSVSVMPFAAAGARRRDSPSSQSPVRRPCSNGPPQAPVHAAAPVMSLMPRANSTIAPLPTSSAMAPLPGTSGVAPAPTNSALAPAPTVVTRRQHVVTRTVGGYPPRSLSPAAQSGAPQGSPVAYGPRACAPATIAVVCRS